MSASSWKSLLQKQTGDAVTRLPKEIRREARMTTGIVGEYEGSPTSSARRRILVAGTIGTAIEWYDFFIYGLIAPLVFDQLFFPKFDQLTATIAVFATFAVGFLARPLGGLVFGHFGDRLGRKSVLLCTLVMMGLATMAIGLLPTYERAGAS